MRAPSYEHCTWSVPLCSSQPSPLPSPCFSFIVPADGGAAHFVDMVTQALEEAVPSEIMDALD